jgi:hypothetical protein
VAPILESSGICPDPLLSSGCYAIIRDHLWVTGRVFTKHESALVQLEYSQHRTTSRVLFPAGLCHAGALPTELWPHGFDLGWSDFVPKPLAIQRFPSTRDYVPSTSHCAKVARNLVEYRITAAVTLLLRRRH